MLFLLLLSRSVPSNAYNPSHLFIVFVGSLMCCVWTHISWCDHVLRTYFIYETNQTAHEAFRRCMDNIALWLRISVCEQTMDETKRRPRTEQQRNETRFSGLYHICVVRTFANSFINTQRYDCAVTTATSTATAAAAGCWWYCCFFMNETFMLSLCRRYVRSTPGKCVIGLIVKINGLLLLHFIEVDVISSTQNKTGKQWLWPLYDAINFEQLPTEMLKSLRLIFYDYFYLSQQITLHLLKLTVFTVFVLYPILL